MTSGDSSTMEADLSQLKAGKCYMQGMTWKRHKAAYINNVKKLPNNDDSNNDSNILKDTNDIRQLTSII